MGGRKKMKADATVGTAAAEFQKLLNAGERYEVWIMDTENNRRVRSDAKVGAIRKKSKDSAKDENGEV